jgi:lysozyme family protein
MSTQEILRDVPPDRVEKLIAQFAAVGATAKAIPQTNGLFTIVATFEGSVHLAPVATDTVAEAMAAVPAEPEGALPPISTATDFTSIAGEYRAYFDTLEIRPERHAVVQSRVNRLLERAPRYRALGDELGIPWFFIAIIHSLESGANFSTHLHNGDPLTARTVQVPAGRPVEGNPPFTWEASARDALKIKGFVGQPDWSTARMLHRWEANNGFGYRQRRLPSPYLWSFSQHYTKGRFIRDHVFDAESVSQQCGAAVLLKALQRQI